MLGIASLSVLLSYEKAIERLVSQWPRCWGLKALAEDTARAEKLDKIRRRFQQDNRAGRTLPSDWLEDSPWNAWFRALAADQEYWNEQVRHPAAAWMVSGGKGVAMAPAEQAALAHTPGGSELLDLEADLKVDNRRKQSNRDERAAKQRRIKAEREELEIFRKRGTSADARGGGQDKGKGKGKSKDQAGTQICYSCANGTGSCGSV